MNCQKCGSKRMANLNGKSSDCNSGGIATVKNENDICSGADLFTIVHQGYVPNDWGVGGGDYIDITFCLDCGQLKGKWPRQLTKLENYTTDDCEKCSSHCNNKAVDPHTCPFAEEIRGDSETLCECCEDCEYQCSQSI